MRKYPIGLQDFRKIREGGFLYIDKTERIHELIESGHYYFLSRPRRFGKSLILATIKEIFSGSQELFEGLWIENNWNWEKKNPVIHLSFSQMNYESLGLYQALIRELDLVANKFGIALEEQELKLKFQELILKLSKVAPVVILIDEYDKPIIDYVDKMQVAWENESIMKNFYSVLKDADAHIRLLLITGVSRFTRVSIFSDLNNLRDITLSPQFATLAGITQTELESNFGPEIEKLSLDFSDILQQIKDWYNGYSWNGTDKLYNPFSLLNFMADGDFQNYWIKTGAPAFLIKEVRTRPDFAFTEADLVVGVEGIEDLYIESLNPVTMMFQTGFLTIKAYNRAERLYTLGYPNREVKESVLTHLLSAFSFEDTGRIKPMVVGLKKAFIQNDIPLVVRIINSLFSNIPNPLWKGAKEAFYHGLIHNTFQMLGIDLASEVYSANGRLDVAVKTVTHIYVIEFKLDSTPQKALDQIFDQSYLLSYALDTRQKVAIGINFSSVEKNISAYLIKEI